MDGVGDITQVFTPAETAPVVVLGYDFVCLFVCCLVCLFVLFF